jgi:hypothetical protein
MMTQFETVNQFTFLDFMRPHVPVFAARLPLAVALAFALVLSYTRGLCHRRQPCNPAERGCSSDGAVVRRRWSIHSDIVAVTCESVRCKTYISMPPASSLDQIAKAKQKQLSLNWFTGPFSV